MKVGEAARPPPSGCSSSVFCSSPLFTRRRRSPLSVSVSISSPYSSSSTRNRNVSIHHRSWYRVLPLLRVPSAFHLTSPVARSSSSGSSISKAPSLQDKDQEEEEDLLLCEVLWSIEADLAEGQLLYIVADPFALGCWNLDMAILMFPTQHHHNVNCWEAHIKVPCGINFKYNYFIRPDKSSNFNIIWRPGPEYSVSIPLSAKPNQPILITDTWITTLPTHRLPLYLWGSWLDLDRTSLPSSDDRGSFKSLKRDSLSSQSKRFSTDVMSHNLPHPNQLDDTLSFSTTEGMVSNKTFSETGHPIEEPWLPFLMFDPIVLSKESNQDDFMQKELPDSNYHVNEVPERGSWPISLENPTSTIILINSSVCTMQRIAILEDDKLVELLLEPVKNNVQCDSIYLGEVTRLVPNMGGAFVNIGISRPSLMDIKNHRREPFVFPPFSHKAKGKNINGSAITEFKEQSDTNDNTPTSVNDADTFDGFEEVIFQDDSVHFSNEDYEDHEVEDDFDVPDVPNSNCNGSVVGFGTGVDDCDNDFYRNGHHISDASLYESISTETAVPDASQSSHLVLKDRKDPNKYKWDYVRKGTKVIVQVTKEGLGTKGPTLTAYPNLRSRFWILITRCERVGVSKKISGVERTRLRVIAKTLQPAGFGLTVRTVAAGHSLEELQKDLEGLLSTWKSIIEHAKSAALAADEGVEGAVPVILHRAMGQTLSVAQDYFNEKVKKMVVDSPRTYHEITSYLQEIAPDLCGRVELYDKKIPIFDEYAIEEEINNMLSKRVPLANGGSLVIEQTEALVSIDVNGGHGMLGGQGNSQEKAILEVNLAAAKQIARELRLRDIGGIIVVDFIDMADDSNRRLVYEEVKKAVERDRSTVKVSELSRHGLMEITRKRVRPSVTFMISEPCTCCHATGRVEALETSFSKIEHEICRLQAMSEQKADPGSPKSWPKFVLRVDREMCNYLTSGKRAKLGLLSSALKVWLLLKVAGGFTRGAFEVKPFVDGKGNGYQSNQVSISRLQPTRNGRSYIPSTKLTLFPVKKWKTGKK